MNNNEVVEIHMVLCDITNEKITRYDGLYKILEIVNKATL